MENASEYGAVKPQTKVGMKMGAIRVLNSRLGLKVNIALILAGLLASIIVYTRLTQTTNAAKPDQITSRLVAGVGTQVQFPATAAEVPQKLSTVLTFMSSRGGVSVSTAVGNRLIALEQATLNGDTKKIEQSQVDSILNAVWFERVSQLTDKEIEVIGVKTRTLPDVTNPPGSQYVELRLSKGSVNINDWLAIASAYRDSSNSTAVAQRVATPGLIAQEVNKRLSLYRTSLPSLWGTTYTTLQVFLLAYSVITDDLMDGSAAQLASQMQSVEDILYTRHGIPRSSAGRKPYGLNGYLYSTATDTLFNEAVQNRILDKIDEVN